MPMFISYSTCLILWTMGFAPALGGCFGLANHQHNSSRHMPFTQNPGKIVTSIATDGTPKR